MKKIILLIITILFTFSINNVKASSYCKYTYNDTNLVVYETGTQAIGYTTDKDNASAKLEAKDFFTNGSFNCASINVDNRNSKTVFYSPTTYASNSDAYVAPTIWASSNGNTSSTCYFEYEKDNNHKLRLLMSVGNNKLTFKPIEMEKISLYDVQTLYFTSQDYVLLKDFMNSEGIYDCQASSLNIALATEFKNSKIDEKNTMYSAVLFSKSINQEEIKINQRGHINFFSLGGNFKKVSPSIITKMTFISIENVPNPPTSGEEIDGNQSESLCDGIFNHKFGQIIKEALNFLKFIVPIIIIGLTIVDFIKAVVSQDDKEVNKAGNKLIKRIIIGVVIFLVPTILELILNLAGIPYGTCGIK